MKLTKLIDEVNEVLTFRWDPIGVSNMSSREIALTEYRSYAKGIAKMLRANVAEYKVREYLTMLRTKHIGMPADDDADIEIVRMLMDLKTSGPASRRTRP
ncbi:MAG: hypothetical protein AAGA55_11855 [Planctomycetota bacterium]